MRLSLSLLLMASCSLIAADWPTVMGPHKTGISHEKIVDKFPEAGPKLVWETEVGPGFSNVSIADGKAYLLDRKDDEFDVFRVLDAKTGKEEWRFENRVPGRLSYNGSRALPTIKGNMAYALGGFGDLYAIDLKKQVLKWQVNIREAYGAEPPRWGYSQSPLVVGDMVIVAPMSDSTEVAALNVKNGEKAWATPSYGGRSYVSPLLYEFLDTEMIIFIARTNTVGLDPKTGEELWKIDSYPSPIPIANATKVDDNSFLITSGYGAGTVQLSLAKEDGKFTTTEDFRYEFRGAQIHPPLYYKGHVYANFNNNENLSTFGKPKYDAEGIVCIDKNGETKWATGMTPDVDRGGLIIVDDKILFMGGEDGILRMAEATPKGLNIISKAKVFETGARDNQIWAPMIFANGKLYVRDQSTLKCFDLSS